MTTNIKSGLNTLIDKHMKANIFCLDFGIKFKTLKSYLLEKHQLSIKYTMIINKELLSEVKNHFDLKEMYVFDEKGKKRRVNLHPLETCQNQKRDVIPIHIEKEPFYSKSNSLEKSVPMGGQPGYKLKSKRRSNI